MGLRPLRSRARPPPAAGRVTPRPRGDRPAAFITTEGFRDLLEIGRQVRPPLYDMHFEKPAPLVLRNLCFEVGERLDAHGNELEPLDEGAVRASGYPIRTPVIDLVEIGAGGGSIARVDSGGILRVGPESAGADPGPICYGKGGEHPTITDANLVLGRLNPEFFLGGEMGLRADAARDAEKGTRPVWFRTAGDFVATPVYDRSRLAAEHRFEGPAIVEEMDSTTLVLPGYEVTVDRFGNLLISPAGGSA